MSSTPKPFASHATPAVLSGRIAPFLGAISLLVPLSVDMYLPSFPALQQAFACDAHDVERSLSSFFTGMLLGQLIWGLIADKVGRRLPVVLGLTLYVVSSLVCLVAPSLEWLVWARAAQAFGGCAGMVIARAIVRDAFVGLRAAQIYATLSLVQGLGPILGPSIGAVVSTQAGWQGVFATLTLAGTVLLVAAWYLLPETLLEPRRDLTIRQAAVTYVDILRDGSFMRFALTGSVMGAGMFAYISGSPYVFMELFGLSQQQYGAMFALNAVGLVIAAQSNRLVARRFAAQDVLRLMTAVGALSAIALLIALCAGASLRVTLAPLACFLAALGLIWPNVAACAFAQQGHRAGMAAATQGALHWGCACLASLAVGALHDGTARPMGYVIAASALVGAANYALWGDRARQLMRRVREWVSYPLRSGSAT